MIRIVCSLAFDPVHDAGHADESTIRAACVAHPDIRPCGLYHGWVVKTWCKKCEKLKSIEGVDDHENEL